jgi:hypothetical protein
MKTANVWFYPLLKNKLISGNLQRELIIYMIESRKNQFIVAIILERAYFLSILYSTHRLSEVKAWGAADLKKRILT